MEVHFNKIMTMLQLQDRMNSIVDADWRERKREWYRAIWVESAEMMDHYGWKWWKKQQPDMAQVHLELVDIWHFGLSYVIEQTPSLAAAAEYLVAEADESADPDPDKCDLRVVIELFSFVTIKEQSFAPALFYDLMKVSGLTFDQLFTMYVGKNVLNIFRQDHGYKDGTYVKVWDGREDNEYLVEIMESLDSNDTNFADQVYAGLKQKYPS